ncbi:MAG: thioredoxin family protein [Deltaproteobacteria bacterium]|nr:thioredoxin family protein [Deltaproteobacteria bacterium]
MMNAFFFFFAGIFLNLTPCVLPVIPLKVRAVLKELDQHIMTRILVAIFLLMGCLVFFVSLGGLIAYLGWKWNAFFQSKVFIIFLTFFLALSAISMLANWSIRLPQVFYRIHIHRYTGAFFIGLLAAVLSTPCSGPFLGGVLAYALMQSPLVIMTLFIAIGFGLSLPYIIILIFPQLVRYMPRNGKIGRQMEIVMAFVLITGAIFFAKTFLPDFILFILWISVAVGILIWGLIGFKRAHILTESFVPGICILVTICIVFLVFGPSKRASLEWQPYSAESFNLVQSQSILLDFTADWCINCKILEKTTYASPEVIKAAKHVGLIAFQIDMTEYNEEEKKLIEEYGGAVLPFAVLINRDGKVANVFSGMMSAETLKRAIMQMDGNSF